MPLVLLLPECDPRDRPDKRTILLGLFVMKRDADRMEILVILVDQHQRPLSIRPEHGIHRNQNMPLGILNIARGTEKAMLSILRLRPFLRQHLCRKKLRRALLDEVIMVGCEHMIGSPTIPTGGMRRGVRQCMMIVGGLSPGRKKCGKGFSQPQRSKDLD